MTYGEEMIERLPPHSPLNNEKNLMRTVLLKTIGAFLDDFDDKLLDFFNGVFLTEAEGKYLDFLGSNYNIPRKIKEDDENYRKRITYELLGHITVDYLKDIYGIEIYALIDDFDVSENPLTCDNPYLLSKFMILADEDAKKSIKKKIVLDSDVVWRTI